MESRRKRKSPSLVSPETPLIFLPADELNRSRCLQRDWLEHVRRREVAVFGDFPRGCQLRRCTRYYYYYYYYYYYALVTWSRGFNIQAKNVEMAVISLVRRKGRFYYYIIYKSLSNCIIIYLNEMMDFIDSLCCRWNTERGWDRVTSRTDCSLLDVTSMKCFVHRCVRSLPTRTVWLGRGLSVVSCLRFFARWPSDVCQSIKRTADNDGRPTDVWGWFMHLHTHTHTHAWRERERERTNTSLLDLCPVHIHQLRPASTMNRN